MLQSMGLQRVGHDLGTEQQRDYTKWPTNSMESPSKSSPKYFFLQKWKKQSLHSYKNARGPN